MSSQIKRIVYSSCSKDGHDT